MRFEHETSQALVGLRIAIRAPKISIKFSLATELQRYDNNLLLPNTIPIVGKVVF